MAETAAEGEPSSAAEVVEDLPVRVRRSLDLVRLVGLLLLLALLAGLGTVASDTADATNDDLTRLLDQVPHLIIRALSLVGSLAALAVPIALVIREIVRGQARRLIEGLVAGVVAIGVVNVLNRAVLADSGSALHRSLTDLATGTTARPLDPYLAAVVALVTLVGVAGEPTWWTVCWSGIGGYLLSAFVAGQGSVLALIASPLLGAAIGVAVRYVAGSTNERPGGRRIIDALQRRGIRIVRMEQLPSPGELHRAYGASTEEGRRLSVQVLDRDVITTGALYRFYRRLRIRAAVATPPAMSLESVAERRSLLAVAADSAGVRTPQLVAGVPCGPDAIVLAYAELPGTRLVDPTDRQLVDLWRNVEKLHTARMTHRGLAADRICADGDGHVLLPIPTDGAVFASELRISLSRAEVLIASAQLTGAERSVRVARTVLTDAELAATVPLLQPVALPREARGAVKRDGTLLQSLRDQIRAQTHQRPPAPIRVERFRPRVIVSIVAIIVAGYLIVGQLSSVDLVTVVSTAKWGWVPLALVASAGTYLAAALSLTGYVKEKLSFTRTVLAQLAASFVGFVTPPSVGGLAINIRYLRKAKLSATAAATSVSLSQVINAVAHVVLLLLVAAATGTSSAQSLPLPGWAFAAVGVLAVLMLIVLAIPAPRQWVLARVLPPLREALPRLVDLISSPVKLTQALLGTVLVNVCYVAALWFAVRAFGGEVSLSAVAVVYLAGAAVASAAPTPGGLGAVELALSTGLTAAGMAGSAAVSAVLLFRIATFWLPVPAGWVAMHLLQRSDAL